MDKATFSLPFVTLFLLFSVSLCSTAAHTHDVIFDPWAQKRVGVAFYSYVSTVDFKQWFDNYSCSTFCELCLKKHGIQDISKFSRCREEGGCFSWTKGWQLRRILVRKAGAGYFIWWVSSLQWERPSLANNKQHNVLLLMLGILGGRVEVGRRNFYSFVTGMRVDYSKK